MNGSCRINGLTHINLTKLDCLDALDTIQLGVAYKLHGKTIHSVPSDLPSLEQVTPKAETDSGFSSNIGCDCIVIIDQV